MGSDERSKTAFDENLFDEVPILIASGVSCGSGEGFRFRLHTCTLLLLESMDRLV